MGTEGCRRLPPGRDRRYSWMRKLAIC